MTPCRRCQTNFKNMSNKCKTLIAIYYNYALQHAPRTELLFSGKYYRADPEYQGRGTHGVWRQTLRIFDTVYLEERFKVFGKT